MDSIPDNQLMRQVRDGEVEQMGVLFERHHFKLFNYFLRLTDNHATSEDLVQDVFLRMLKYRKSYAGESPFVPWMYQIARNAHYDVLRKKKPEQPWGDDESAILEESVSQELSPDMSANQRQEVQLLRQALARLPLEKREVLVLSRIQELKCEEIAKIVRCEPGTVRVRVHRALQELKVILSRLMKEEAI